MGRFWLLGAVLAATLFSPAAASAADRVISVGPGKTLNPSGSAAITTGDTVIWRWAEDQAHHIMSTTAGSPESWDSLERKAGPDFTHTFATPGAYPYHCALHPDKMFGTITVTDVPPPPDNVGPTASLTASTTTPANGADVTLNAGGSVDTDGTIADYAWDLDGDLTFETPGGTVPTLVHAFTTPGPVTVRVLVTDNAGGTGGASVTLNVAAPTPADPPAGQAPPPAEQTPPASQPAPPGPGLSITQPMIVPVALTANSAPPPARPAFSAPAGQHLKRQKGVKVGVSCPAGCQLVLSGNVKVGGRTLKLKKLTRSVGAGKPATLTLLVADAKALRKARGKARASIKAGVTVGGQTSTQNVAVSLTS